VFDSFRLHISDSRRSSDILVVACCLIYRAPALPAYQVRIQAQSDIRILATWGQAACIVSAYPDFTEQSFPSAAHMLHSEIDTADEKPLLFC